MEFYEVYGGFVTDKIDDRIIEVELESSRIEKGIINEEQYILYNIKMNKCNSHCSVGTDLKLDRLRIYFFTSNGLKGKALEDFKEYLKENHKKNIVNLSI